MKSRAHGKFTFGNRRHAAGLTILDVLLAIVIFAIGMLALASLQGNLTRSSSDANARTTATNIAEQIIEQFRTFRYVQSGGGADPFDLDNLNFAFQDIVDGLSRTACVVADETEGASGVGVVYVAGTSCPAGRMPFNVNVNVENFYFVFDDATGNTEATNDLNDLPAGRDASIPDFKYVELTVAWDAPGLVGAGPDDPDTPEDESRLGSGEFTLASVIPPVSSFSSAVVAAAEEEGSGMPPISYTPGQAPDTVAIGLGDSKYKESTKPEPIVWRDDELMETWFDVITYRKAGDEAIFQRREEFVSISCICDLQGPGSVGRLPTIWDGAEYIEGEFTEKPAGVISESVGRQSQYCEVCCRDHHDAGSGPNSYRPWAADFAGDHPHYNRDVNGNLFDVTGEGGNVTYLEACRLVRKDGFFRVAQDFNLNEINAFPENYPMASWDVREYSNYVRGVAQAELGAASDPAPANVSLSYDGRDEVNRSIVPPAAGDSSPGQQLRSRGIYIDTMTSALQQTIADCFDSPNDDCKAPNASSVEELYPFFDVQLTHLARWSETEPNNPVEITNEEISNQGYSRGKAAKAGSLEGWSVGHTVIDSGNAGLISLLPVTASPVAENKQSDLFLQAADGTEPPPPSDYPTIRGTISAAGGTADATILTLTPSTGVECFKPTNETFVCMIGPDAPGTSPTLTVSNYSNKNKDLFISSNLSTVGCLNYVDYTNLDPVLYPEPDPNTNYTIFALPTLDTSDVSLVINVGLCP